jgi:hypothetical protein
MKKLLVFLLLVSSFGLSADSNKSKTIKNLEITVIGEYQVKVYKGMKHMFSFDCRPYISCEIFTTTKDDPSYKLFDGRVYASDDLKPLAINNIEEVIGYNTNFYDGTISFFITITTPSATTGSATMYIINTETGAVAVNAKEWDWFRYGMTKPKKNNGCLNIVYC